MPKSILTTRRFNCVVFRPTRPPWPVRAIEWSGGSYLTLTVRLGAVGIHFCYRRR